MSGDLQREWEEARMLVEAGVAASARNDTAHALRMFEQAAASAPAWALPRFLLGSEFAAMGEWQKAESELANAVLLDDSLHIARYQLGLLQFTAGRVAMALVTWQPLLARPSSDDGLSDFVQGFMALEQDDFAAARVHFGRGSSCADVNPAVAQDVQRTVAAMPASPGEAPLAAPARESQPAPAHVLVANYGKTFTVH